VAKKSMKYANKILVCTILILLYPALSYGDWQFHDEFVSLKEFPGGFDPQRVVIDKSGYPHFIAVASEFQEGNLGSSLFEYYFTGKRWENTFLQSNMSSSVAFAMDSKDHKHLIFQEAPFPGECIYPP